MGFADQQVVRLLDPRREQPSITLPAKERPISHVKIRQWPQWWYRDLCRHELVITNLDGIGKTLYTPPNTYEVRLYKGRGPHMCAPDLAERIAAHASNTLLATPGPLPLNTPTPLWGPNQERFYLPKDRLRDHAFGQLLEDFARALTPDYLFTTMHLRYCR